MHRSLLCMKLVLIIYFVEQSGFCRSSVLSRSLFSGNYSRAYLERRLNSSHLHNFRQDLAPTGGLSSYSHPY